MDNILAELSCAVWHCTCHRDFGDHREDAWAISVSNRALDLQAMAGVGELLAVAMAGGAAEVAMGEEVVAGAAEHLEPATSAASQVSGVGLVAEEFFSSQRLSKGRMKY